MLPVRGMLPLRLARLNAPRLATVGSLARPLSIQSHSIERLGDIQKPAHSFRAPLPSRLLSSSARRWDVVVPPASEPVAPSQPEPQPKKRAKVWVIRSLWVLKGIAFIIGSSVLGVAIVTGGILAHDSLTYEEVEISDVSVNALALNPPRGGPKNLPISQAMIDDEDEPNQPEKPKLVIIGAGWGAVGVLKTLNPDDYHVTVVSESTFNQFTPLLPSAAVGTVSVRSLVESVRKLLSPLKGHFVYGRAVDLVMSDRLLEVEVDAANGGKQRIYVPYDKLVIAVGSVSATHGVKGLEHCFQLKTISDSQQIRRRIIENFEIASLPTTTPEDRKRLLSFVICGGGPTGVETAAEISDLVHEDLVKYYPRLCAKEVKISIIQSRDHILNTYSQTISEYAEKRFQREAVDVIVNARVKEVTKETVVYSVKDPKTGKVEDHVLPTNFTLWSTGIAMNPFTARVTDLLPNQVHQKALTVDAHLRVVGAPLGTVYAVGDASTIETSLVPYILDLIEQADTNHDEKIDFDEWKVVVQEVKRRVPMSSIHLEKCREVFKEYDKDADDALSFNELHQALIEIGNKITTLPATAQVASQQGKYLGKKFTKLVKARSTLEANQVPGGDDDHAYSKPFEYKHLGSLAYVGNAAVFDMGGYSFTGGLAAMYAWRSVYWSEQVSWRTKMLLMMDWVVRGLCGRDLSKL